MNFTPDTIFTHIEPRIQLDIKTGCWKWKLGTDRNGYAKMNYKNDKGRWTVAANLHRVVYQAYNGPIEDTSLVISHTCNCRNCINPAHMELTTQKKNVEEQIRQKTHASTMKTRNRLSPEVREDIYTRLMNGESSYSIAKLYKQTISGITLYRKRLPAWIAKNTKPQQDTALVAITETLTFKEA